MLEAKAEVLTKLDEVLPADAILALGVVVGRELGYEPIPILQIDVSSMDASESEPWVDGTTVRIGLNGGVTKGD